MKIRKFAFMLRTPVLLLALGAGIVFQGCDEELAEGPSITLSAPQASNTQGSTVSTALTINAPEGLKAIDVLKNGVPDTTIIVNGNPTTHQWTFEHTISTTAALGSTVNFTFLAIDAVDRKSDAVAFRINVTSFPIREVSGNLIGNHLWHNDTIYRLNGFVRVGRDEQLTGGVWNNQVGTLTIEPGTIIVGDKESKGTLVVQRGSRIIAEGTAQDPIIMTSEAPAGQRMPGDWGGLVICGRVRNNQGANVQLEGGYGAWHGGTVTMDDTSESSGILRFVRIEFAGIPINPNEEVNSLTLGSVGKGTVIENIMVSHGLDDAFEWFGGSVNSRYLISYRNLDDDLDIDFGYQGNVQFVLVIRDPSDADQSGSNAFEVDNNGQGTAAEPFTAGRFANVTVIGPKKTRETTIHSNYLSGAHLRRNSMLRIYNSFITGFPRGIFIDGDASVQHAINDQLQLRNVILAGVDGWGGNGYGSAFDAAAEGTVAGLPFVDGTGTARGNHPTLPRFTSLASTDVNFNVVSWFNTQAHGNRRLARWQDAGLNPTIFDLVANPQVLPNAGSILLTSALWTNVPVATDFQQVPFVGAFGTVNWTAGWAEWLPNTVQYF